MVGEIILYILIGLGIFFALPSTVYTFMFFGVFYKQRNIMLEKDDLKGTQYYPFAEKFKIDIPKARSLACQTISIKSLDGIFLVGRYYDVKSTKLVIFAHGYQSNAFNNFSTALVDFLDRGYNVLLIDQRAHGDSEGKFTTLGCKEKDDLLLWIDYADKNFEVDDIIIYGISMGATTVGYASEEIKNPKVKGLIMEAGFTCFYEELLCSLNKAILKGFALNYLYLTAKTFLKIDIKKRVEDSLKNNSIPVLFLHGDDDKSVSIEFTEQNFLACASKKQKIIVNGAGHTLCYIVGGEPLHREINRFIDECIAKN